MVLMAAFTNQRNEAGDIESQLWPESDPEISQDNSGSSKEVTFVPTFKVKTFPQVRKATQWFCLKRVSLHLSIN